MPNQERSLRDGVFLLILAGISLAFIRLLQPFLLSVFIAVVLANVFSPPHRWMLQKSGKPRLSAAVITLVVVLVVMIPVLIVTTLVTGEVLTVVESVRHDWESRTMADLLPAMMEYLEALPIVGAVLGYLPDFDIATTLRDTAATAGEHLLRILQQSIGDIAAALLNTVLMLLLLFFFLLDGSKVVKRLRAVIPVSNRDVDEISHDFFAVTSATLISTIIIGLLEGALATVLFLIFALPSPFLWGVITVVLSMIPLIGTNLVVIPAGILTILSGRPVAGVLIIVIGATGVAFTQNILKPRLVGERTGLHPALALLSTIGGLAWFGIIGFLIGPVVASLFVAVWRLFAEKHI